ncbi:hypothetical protein I4I73_04710 [Pseudonocardia sp. KRD-184]|uniref:Uncharacterized protein n=1 Tax=Pseudonocardia oceani TaxID=2792013 RepID=A0ABS6U591_9PSEU|nr:hypothetical protein [Pseudonocardia oceani]MBW0089641.1 hypothetical protein [Pseudonocardia oceani]MBW0095300.1 hypothetical protein [Pseudonocardia oceani]MBW0121784.1 hypothetical protein [Pseudonocardia oceani]MBW0127397.1 hypothetical protein [Pseudonocardia oceani]
MRVTFTRTGERRYAVTAERPVGDRVAADPAPGFHAHVPHDLVHFVVERQLGLREGIYGTLADGGDAGTFRPLDEPYSKKWARRNTRPIGRPDMARSERLAQLVQGAWEVRHAARPTSPGIRAWLDERAAGVDPALVDELVDRLDELAPRWHALRVGGSITLDWPAPAHPGPGRRR